MPRGGKRDGAGRPPGQPNRDTAQRRAALADLVDGHVQTAVATLAEIAKNGESESARISASTAILDRAYGRPAQAVALDVTDTTPEQSWQVTISEEFSPITAEALAEFYAAKTSYGTIDYEALSSDTLGQIVEVGRLMKAARDKCVL